MDTTPRCNMGFPDDDEDDGDDFGKEASSRKELVVKTDGGNDKNNNSADQKPSTPRSKHSATEQLRRSRINDRFRILRDLMPHGDDQKKDKASILLEVIEYIQFLQEKVQKYELPYPGWSPDSAKLMLWKTSHTHGENIVDPVKHSPASTGFIFPADGTISAPGVVSNTPSMVDFENLSSGLASKSASMPIPMQYPSVGTDSGFSNPWHRLISDSDNISAPPQAEWPRSYAADSCVSGEMFIGQEELLIDEGTISLSNVYSDRLLSTLTQALRSSGVDLSQASISVQINLGKRTINRAVSRPEDHDGPSSNNRLVGHSRVRSCGQELEDSNKSPKSDMS